MPKKKLKDCTLDELHKMSQKGTCHHCNNKNLCSNIIEVTNISLCDTISLEWFFNRECYV